MSYLTFNYLNQRTASLHEAFESRGHHNFEEYSKNRIFLSHRHKDKQIVEKVVGFLQEIGATIYIDYLDHSLPDKTSFETAKTIRNKIDSSEKFILLATPNSSESKWIPWELGLGDKKGLNNVAILPLLNESSSWAEREYYQIYGRIKLSQKNKWCFFPPFENLGVLLKDWLIN